MASVPVVPKMALPAAQDHPFLPNHGPRSIGEERLIEHFAGTLYPHNNFQLCTAVRQRTDPI